MVGIMCAHALQIFSDQADLRLSWTQAVNCHTWSSFSLIDSVDLELDEFQIGIYGGVS